VSSGGLDIRANPKHFVNNVHLKKLTGIGCIEINSVLDLFISELIVIWSFLWSLSNSASFLEKKDLFKISESAIVKLEFFEALDINMCKLKTLLKLTLLTAHYLSSAYCTPYLSTREVDFTH